MWAINDLANVLAVNDLTNYSTDAILRDCTRVHVRAIRDNDKERLARHFDGLSAESRYHRFFGIKNGFTACELRYFTEPDFPRHVALVVTAAGGDGAEAIVSDGRYVVLPDRICVAELALSVVDSCQRRGFGALVLECLIATARRSSRSAGGRRSGFEPRRDAFSYPAWIRVHRNIGGRMPRGTVGARARRPQCCRGPCLHRTGAGHRRACRIRLARN